ncbi:MAG TPA: cation diffusion facilitator family transporter [Terriglobales bacterium]|nr:cation diffusion facilitator family transporter [Terriglobales bacterium]
MTVPHDDTGLRLRAGMVSLAVSVVLLAAKYFAYQLTGSTAILSDALESIVNVVAALFALAGLLFAGMPADRNHPYGHGKIEFFSAAFEGGLIAFAALLIVYQAFHDLLYGSELQQLDVGVAITAAAGLANLALGRFLIRTGKRLESATLIADGEHVRSDFVTSAGIVIGLLLVRFTGILWLDPLVALVVGVHLAWAGLWLVRDAAGALLDEEDVPTLERLIEAMNDSRVDGIIRVHNLRAIRAGRFHHVDAHLVVPEFWPVFRAHGAADAFEAQVIARCGIQGEINFHTDPCRRAYCPRCDINPCPIRAAPFQERTALTTDEAVLSDAEMLATRRVVLPPDDAESQG